MRSVVRVYPGPPLSGSQKPEARNQSPEEPISFWLLTSGFLRPSPDGAIAQLGERLLCKQEVVGSIPSGSTNTRAYLLNSRAHTFRCGTRLSAIALRNSAECAALATEPSFANELGLRARRAAIFYIVKRGLT